MFWTKQIPKILQARPRKFTGEGLEKMQHCVQGQATSPTTGLVSGGQFLAHLPNSFCTSIKNLKIFFNPKSTSNKPMPCKIRQSSMKYTGSLDYWDEWLIDQFISLFFFINLQKQKVLCALKIMKKKCLEHHQTFGLSRPRVSYWRLSDFTWKSDFEQKTQLKPKMSWNSYHYFGLSCFRFCRFVKKLLQFHKRNTIFLPLQLIKKVLR